MHTIFTRHYRMNRNKYKPAAKELYSWDHWNARKQKPLHPVEVGLAATAGFSLLTIVVCVAIHVFQSLQSDPDYSEVQKVLDVLWTSVWVMLTATGLYLVWNRFVRHG